MTKITNPSQSPQNNGGGNKGTAENPYTEAEYNIMIDDGTWVGGYVEGLGYCGRNTDITYDPDNSQSESETSNSDSNRWGHWSSFPWSSNYDSSSWRNTPWSSWSSSSNHSIQKKKRERSIQKKGAMVEKKLPLAKVETTQNFPPLQVL